MGCSDVGISNKLGSSGRGTGICSWIRTNDTTLESTSIVDDSDVDDDEEANECCSNDDVCLLLPMLRSIGVVVVTVLVVATARLIGLCLADGIIISLSNGCFNGGGRKESSKIYVVCVAVLLAVGSKAKFAHIRNDQR